MSETMEVAEALEQADAQPQAAVPPSIGEWIAARHAEGRRLGQIFNSMRRNGWKRERAVRELEQALPETLHEDIRLLARAAPDPDLSGAGATITIDGHAIEVLCESSRPRLVVFRHLLSDEECDALVESARARMRRSTVGDGDRPEQSEVRTSSGMFLGRDETALCTAIDVRIAALLDWPVRCGESLQVLRYEKAQEYRPHHDYFSPPEGDWAPVIGRGGNRVATLLIYLSTPERGGATCFPEMPFEVRAVKGNAVFFSYPSADAESRTEHAGAPVIEGEKWVAVKWLRQATFD